MKKPVTYRKNPKYEGAEAVTGPRTGFAYVLVSLLAWTGGMRILYLGAAAPFYLGSPSFREGWNTDRRLRIDERTSSLAVGTGFGGVLMLLALVLFALG